jgi:hypothetical protein
VTHRNKIKANDKELLLTMPLLNKESLINDLLIVEPDKNLKKHWAAIETNYRKTKYWNFLSHELYIFYMNKYERLVDLNIDIIKFLMGKLNISCKLIKASSLDNIIGNGSDRNLSICKTLKADVYLSGSGAKKYNDEQSFINEDIEIRYNDFKHPVYPQLGKNFIPNLSAIDMLFNCGEESKNYI